MSGPKTTHRLSPTSTRLYRPRSHASKSETSTLSDSTSGPFIWRVEHGFNQNEGLAHELAAQYNLAHGLETAGYAHLRNACNRYERWGAHGKVKQLDERYPRMREERTPTSSATSGPPVVELDVETVVRASQAISSEMVLPRLIDKLVRLTVEHAGAERCLLILVQDGEQRIESEATTGPGRPELAEPEPLAQGNGSSPTTDSPTIFTAVQDQLGLKLESGKGPADVFVIDHIKQPSAN